MNTTKHNNKHTSQFDVGDLVSLVNHVTHDRWRCYNTKPPPDKPITDHVVITAVITTSFQDQYYFVYCPRLGEEIQVYEPQMTLVCKGNNTP